MKLSGAIKTCSKCGEAKPADEFHRHKRLPDGRNCRCKACAKEATKAWRLNNLDKAKAYAKSYQAEMLVKGQPSYEAEKARQKAWRDANPDKVKAQAGRVSPEKRKQYNKAAKINRSAQVRRENMARQRGITKATPQWADLRYMNDVYRGCREFEDILADAGITQKFHVDHVVPLKHDKVSGLHNEFNIQVLSAGDNLAKSNTYIII